MRKSTCPHCGVPLLVADELPHGHREEAVEVLVRAEDASDRGDVLIGMLGLRRSADA